MGFIELAFLAAGLSMDAFAVAVCLGLAMEKISLRKALIVGLYFGVFQAVMPLAGFLAAALFAVKFIAYEHWIAFALLGFLGGKMIVGSFRKDGDTQCGDAASLKPGQMLPLALATSIDALAAGVSFAFLRVSIVPAVLLIGTTTLAISMAGVKIGRFFGSRFESKAKLAGGIVLVLIGLKILLERIVPGN
ncbi:MAG: manganese efflux pump MntP family protein [Treponema sp.]|nr:manganese efflux pump MntP family protein [Treponema sp.]